MAGNIVYLDIDDEITSAAARVRDVPSRRVALVLPYGSRVATSRINFRLLSRDALIGEKQLAVVAGDAATRALAASAGLPVFSSVGEYEASLEGLVEASDAPAAPPATTATATATGRSRRTSAKAPAPPAAASAAAAEAALAQPGPPATRSGLDDPTIRLAVPREPQPAPAPPREEPSPRPDPRSTFVPQPRSAAARGPRLPLLIALAVLGLVALVGGVAGYVVLPSATIVVTPRAEPLVPLELTVTADPAVGEPDAAALVVPATVVSVDVAASDTFPATGKRIEETAAEGTVRFSNLDFLRSNEVPGGSIVSTNAGVRFRTVASVTVPRANLVGLKVFPARVTVGVTAVEPGLSGNVEPNTIVIVPKGEDPQALKVVNPDATTGGTHDEFPQVAHEDIDGAVAQLTADLGAAFEVRLAEPSVAPAGATIFPATAALGDPTPSVDPATLVGQEVDSFELELTATGTVVAVDPAPVAVIAEERLRATVAPGQQLVAGSIDVRVGEGVASGQSVSFDATATAEQVAILDADSLRILVLGRSLDDARTVLAPFGDVELTVWPDWVDSIPTMESRVELRVEGSVPVETPTPSAPTS